MQFRQLYLSDFDITMGLIRAHVPENSEYVADPSMTALERYEFILRQWYLPGITHKMFGGFIDTNLVVMGGMRLDLAFSTESWCMTNLKVHPKLDPSQGAIPRLVGTLYTEARNLGMVEYYTCMLETRHRQFIRYVRQYVPEVMAYDRWVDLKIPAGTIPKYDFYWGMMGRRTYEANLVITRSRLKEYPLPPEKMHPFQGKLTDPAAEAEAAKTRPRWPKYTVPDYALDGVLVGL
jgi:hypothetical protein